VKLKTLHYLLLLSMFFAAIPPALAQTNVRVRVGALNMEAFPRITTVVDVRDAGGFFVSGLQVGNVTILEDSVTIPAGELTEVRPGGQIVFAITPGTSFSIRDTQGFTRFDYVKGGIQAWADGLIEDPIDDLSLVTTSGTAASHREDPTQFIDALAAYQPQTETATPTLEVLANALDVALDATPREGMGRAVVFITPALGEEFNDGLQSLAERARDGDVRVYVWLVDSAGFFSNELINPLRNLAAQTGGQFIAFSGSEPIPDLEMMLESSRRAYRLAYRSRINQAGMHTMVVQVDEPRVDAVSAPLEFDVQLQAPKPVFVSLPGQIVRAIPDDERVADENYLPHSQLIEIVIDFPDTILREVRRTTLYLNGAIIAENVSPPFDRFTFDISTYLESERVLLLVEAEDELGMVGQSIETPVQITVQNPQRNFLSLISRNLPLFAAGVALVAGVALFLVLVLAGRLRPQTLAERSLSRPLRSDPVSQPLAVIEKQWIEAKDTEDGNGARPQEQEAGRLAWLARRFGGARLPWQEQATMTEPRAFLIPISEAGQPDSGEVFALPHGMVVFGSQEGISTILIDDPAVEDRHARLWQDEDGRFHIADEETVAGTWLNYAAVSHEGAILRHGDLVHFGRKGYRFTLSEPDNPRRPVVKAVPDEEQP
jgi:hypothetical protein